MILRVLLVLVLSACGASQPRDSQDAVQTTAAIGQRRGGTHDWPRFGWDASGSNASPDSTGITAANVGTMKRQQVAIDGTVDASPIYLHGVMVNGATHDVFFVTTDYGKTIAIDANDGSILWRYTPPGYESLTGSRRVTTTTPVADPGRNFIYAASPDGRIQKLSVADGSPVWRTAVTTLPEREKLASALNYYHGKVIAATGGDIVAGSP